MSLTPLSETESRGRILSKPVRTQNGDYTIRYRVVGYTDRRVTPKSIGWLRTGKVGNTHVVLERVDDNASSEPPGTRICLAKHAFNGQWSQFKWETP